MTSKVAKGSKRQFVPTMSAPARAILHVSHDVQGSERVKETVCADDVCTGPSHPDRTLPHRHPILVPTRSHAHGGRHWQVELQRHLNGPLDLNDIAEILA